MHYIKDKEDVEKKNLFDIDPNIVLDKQKETFNKIFENEIKKLDLSEYEDLHNDKNFIESLKRKYHNKNDLTKYNKHLLNYILNGAANMCNMEESPLLQILNGNIDWMNHKEFQINILKTILTMSKINERHTDNKFINLCINNNLDIKESINEIYNIVIDLLQSEKIYNYYNNYNNIYMNNNEYDEKYQSVHNININNREEFYRVDIKQSYNELNDFKEFFGKWKTYLSGSFAKHCISNKEKNIDSFSDIDIYFNSYDEYIECCNMLDNHYFINGKLNIFNNTNSKQKVDLNSVELKIDEIIKSPSESILFKNENVMDTINNRKRNYNKYYNFIDFKNSNVNYTIPLDILDTHQNIINCDIRNLEKNIYPSSDFSNNTRDTIFLKFDQFGNILKSRVDKFQSIGGGLPHDKKLLKYFIDEDEDGDGDDLNFENIDVIINPKRIKHYIDRFNDLINYNIRIDADNKKISNIKINTTLENYMEILINKNQNFITGHFFDFMTFVEYLNDDELAQILIYNNINKIKNEKIDKLKNILSENNLDNIIPIYDDIDENVVTLAKLEDIIKEVDDELFVPLYSEDYLKDIKYIKDGINENYVLLKEIIDLFKLIFIKFEIFDSNIKHRISLKDLIKDMSVSTNMLFMGDLIKLFKFLNKDKITIQLINPLSISDKKYINIYDRMENFDFYHNKCFIDIQKNEAYYHKLGYHINNKNELCLSTVSNMKSQLYRLFKYGHRGYHASGIDVLQLLFYSKEYLDNIEPHPIFKKFSSQLIYEYSNMIKTSPEFITSKDKKIDVNRFKILLSFNKVLSKVYSLHLMNILNDIYNKNKETMTELEFFNISMGMTSDYIEYSNYLLFMSTTFNTYDTNQSLDYY